MLDSYTVLGNSSLVMSMDGSPAAATVIDDSSDDNDERESKRRTPTKCFQSCIRKLHIVCLFDLRPILFGPFSRFCFLYLYKEFL